MPTVKEYNVKLSRLKNTRKMTKTMKMVAANKLRKAQDAQKNVSEFAGLQERALARVLRSSPLDDIHPLLKSRGEPRRILLLVISSDRGLCGGFNNNLNKAVMRQIVEFTEGDREVHLSFCGRRGYSYFKTKANVLQHYESVMNRPAFADACRIGNELQSAYTRRHFDEVYIAYNVFKSVTSQKPEVRKLLPLSVKADDMVTPSGDPLLEPNAAGLVDVLLPKVVNARIFTAMLDSAAGEHAARMTAMENATNNAEELIGSYTLLRNRARQAAITKELIEIISGAEALKAV